MSGKRQTGGQDELLRVWAKPDSTQGIALKLHWEDPAAWGLLLADVARHAAKAYANEGLSEAASLDRILSGLAAEVNLPI